MKCPRCLNEDPRYMYLKNGKLYCRKCIGYGRISNAQEIIDYSVNNVDYYLDYKLTSDQYTLSNYLLERYKKGLNSSIKAVCGAGKTEIVYEVIKLALNNRQRVCFALPRKELVVELSNRIKHQFTNLNISIVYGGHTDNLNGQLVICTTHQLYRYPHCFDLLILDEMDAFPYANNEILNNILLESIRGNYIFMSATSSIHDNVLNKRYHGGKLPVPSYYHLPNWMTMLALIRKLKLFKRQCKPVLVFVPRIEDTDKVQRLLNIFKIKSLIATSKTNNNDNSLLLLKEGQVDCIICTTVFERGITINNVQVVILFGEHSVFNRDTLIQISGRVGRKVPNTKGEVIIYTRRITNEIKECIRTIQKDNA